MSDDNNNTKAFDFVIERKNKEVKLRIEEHKKWESKESVGKENSTVQVVQVVLY